MVQQKLPPSCSVWKLEKASFVAFITCPESNNAFTLERALFCLEKVKDLKFGFGFHSLYLDFSRRLYSLDFVGERNLAPQNVSLAWGLA